MRKGIFTLIVIGLSCIACEPEISENIDFTSGPNLDVSNYLAIGDDFTAGVMSNGLTVESQLVSFPNILATQFAKVDGGDFLQPLMPEGNGSGAYSLLSINSQVCEGSSPQPEIIRGEADEAWKDNVYFNAPFNNVGVQRIKVANLFDDVWSTNPLNNIDSLNDNGAYLARISPAGFEDTTSYADLALLMDEQLNPTFFTAWLGIADVLLYAASGGGYITGNLFGNYNCDLGLPNSPSSLTYVTVFEDNYRAFLQEIVGNDKQGVLLSIPNILNFPYFNAVTKGTTIEGSDSLQVKEFGNCENPYLVWMKEDDENTVVAEIDDFILLPAFFNLGNSPGVPCTTNVQPDSTQPHGLHPDNPLLNSEVLTKEEADDVLDAIEDFNSIIEALASEFNLKYIDTNPFFERYNQTVPFAGADYNNEFLTGNIFSLDGLHLTPRANAFFANYLIENLNQSYQCNLPQAEPMDYELVSYP